MRSLNRFYIITQLSTFFVFLYATSYAAQPSDSAEAVFVHTMYQVKTVLIKQLSTGDIEEMINKVLDMGATGYRLDHYHGGKMGWSLEDKKGRELNSVIFTFSARQPRVGEYLGPLMSFSDAKAIHTWHRNVLSGNFKQISNDKYDMGDNCIAIIKLFKGTTGLGRTIITVECH